MALRTLWDSSALAPIAWAGEAAGVEVQLFGSVASRALLWDTVGIEEPTLFELVPHLADIDIAHSGSRSSTRRLRAAIEAIVPMAQWFRWSIIDQYGLAEDKRLQLTNVKVPLRQLRLGSERNTESEEIDNALKQAMEGNVEVSSNDAYGLSPRATLDTEASAALLFVDAWLDVLDTMVRVGRPQSVTLPSVVSDLLALGLARLETLSQTGRDAALRRLWYRLSGAALRLSPSAFLSLNEMLGLDGLLQELQRAGYPATSFGEPEAHPILISALLDSGRFRVPLIGEQDVFGEWNGLINELLNQVVKRSEVNPRKDERIRLAEGNRAVAALKSIPLTTGRSPSSIAAGPLAQEFIHIGLPAARGELLGIEPEKTTAVVFGHRRSGPILIPACASVSIPLPLSFASDAKPTDAARCTIRLNLRTMPVDCEKLDVFLLRGD